MRNQQNTSWDHVASWYDGLVGKSGQYFHEHVIFPKVISLLGDIAHARVLDVACGQGVFCRELEKRNAIVMGVDASSRLIAAAKDYTHRTAIKYIVDDARTLRTLDGMQFDRIVCILALQNIDPIDELFARVASLLSPTGQFVVVLIHPAFRSPRITGWGEDESKKLIFRRIDRYMTPMKIPIDMHPGSIHKSLTWTYHRPLCEYVSQGNRVGLAVDALEELVSDKVSEGRKAKSENLSRAEIPLFLLLRYVRKQSV